MVIKAVELKTVFFLCVLSFTFKVCKMLHTILQYEVGAQCFNQCFIVSYTIQTY